MTPQQQHAYNNAFHLRRYPSGYANHAAFWAGLTYPNDRQLTPPSSTIAFAIWKASRDKRREYDMRGFVARFKKFFRRKTQTARPYVELADPIDKEWETANRIFEPKRVSMFNVSTVCTISSYYSRKRGLCQTY